MSPQARKIKAVRSSPQTRAMATAVAQARHTCAICNRRKFAGDYPFASGGEGNRLLGTCVECLEVNIPTHDRPRWLIRYGIADYRLQIQPPQMPGDRNRQHITADGT